MYWEGGGEGVKTVPAPIFKLFEPVTSDRKWIAIQCVWVYEEESWFYSISIPFLTGGREYKEEDLIEWVRDYNAGVFDPPELPEDY